MEDIIKLHDKKFRIMIPAAKIDEEVRQVIAQCYDKAKQILSENMPKLHELAEYLLERETITGEEFMHILNEA